MVADGSGKAAGCQHQRPAIVVPALLEGVVSHAALGQP
jgi:hypothetical protein